MPLTAFITVKGFVIYIYASTCRIDASICRTEIGRILAIVRIFKTYIVGGILLLFLYFSNTSIP